jgi:hypothetical protein
MPIVLDNDMALLEAAFNRIPNPLKVRMARIVNTGSLKTFWATEAVLPELREQDNITIEATPLELTFSDGMRLLPMQ